jgi:hypothetical protein
MFNNIRKPELWQVPDYPVLLWTEHNILYLSISPLASQFRDAHMKI